MNTILNALITPYATDSTTVLNRSDPNEYVKTFILRPFINTEIDIHSIKQVLETLTGIGTISYQRRFMFQFNDGNFQILFIIHFSKIHVGSTQLENLQYSVQNWGYHDISIYDEYGQNINCYRLFYDNNVTETLKQDMIEKSEARANKLLRRRDGSIITSAEKAHQAVQPKVLVPRTRSYSTQTDSSIESYEIAKPVQDKWEQKLAVMEAKMKKMDEIIDGLTWFRKGAYNRFCEIERHIRKLNGDDSDDD